MSTETKISQLYPEQVNWIINKHVASNHFYNDNPPLPYEFHLRMVVDVAERYFSILDWVEFLLADRNFKTDVLMAAWGHDLIEDTRTSYNDCKLALSERAADIIFAVSNNKGRTRNARANDAYYAEIRETPGAVFVKLCDRIANVEFSKLTGSPQLEMYRKENSEFLKSLSVSDPNSKNYFGHYVDMVHYLDKLLESV